MPKPVDSHAPNERGEHSCQTFTVVEVQGDVLTVKCNVCQRVFKRSAADFKAGHNA